MPTYQFNCVDCDNEFEEIQRMNDFHISHCPVCDKLLKSIPYPPHIVNGTPTTLGSLAEKNRKEMGPEQYQRRIDQIKQERRENNRFRGQLPAGTSILQGGSDAPADEVRLTKALNKASPQAIEKYVITGKVPHLYQ